MPAAPERHPTISVLGPITARRDGQEVPIGGLSSLVLARLATAAPSAVSVDALVDTLWVAEPPPTARKSIQKYVSELRKTLGPDALLTEGAAYRLAIDVEAVDVHRFERLVLEAHAASDSGQIQAAADRLTEALELWRGPPFAGAPDLPFVADETNRLEEARLSAIEDHMETRLELGRHEGLVASLEDLVEHHPLRERLWASLMLALYRNGRQADALAAYRRLDRRLGEDLGLEPSPYVRELEERILLHDPALAPRTKRRGSLPVTRTSFVGRKRELAELPSLLDRARLVTMLGTGGAGKTRLAVEVAAAAGDSYSHGAWFVDLTTLSNAQGMYAMATDVLGLNSQPGATARDALIDGLTDKHILLIIDNAEHLIGDAAAFAHEVLGKTANTTLLVTSREPLGLTGEVIYPVGPLPVPDSNAAPEELTAADAMTLFADRAVAADPEFRITPEIAETVAEVCRRLDGIPLAVELAARQLQVLGPAELYERLIGHLDLLTAPGEPDERHRTMHAAIEWSYRLLSENQRRLFEIVGVFPGSFTLEAAEFVANDVDAGQVAPDVLAGISALVNASMVTRLKSGRTTRFRLLEPLRGFAAEKAAARGDSDHLSAAHSRWILDLMTRNAAILGPQEAEILARLSAEHHHVPPALDWAIENDHEVAARILIAAMEYLAMMVFRMDWAEDLARALSNATDIPTHLRAEAQSRCALALAENFSNYGSARAWAEEALRTAESSGDDELTGFAELALGTALRNGGMIDRAEASLIRATTIFDADPANEVWSARARHSLSMVELLRGNYEEVHVLCDEALATWERIHSDWGAGKTWWLHAAAAAGEGNYEAAEIYADRAHKMFEGTRDAGSTTHVRAVQGDAARLAGELDKADRIYLECLTGFQEISDRRCIASTLKNLGVVAVHQERWVEGSRLLLSAMNRRNKLEDEAGVAECFESLAMMAVATGLARQALPLLAVAERIRAETGSVAPEPERVDIATAVAAIGAELTPVDFEEQWRSAKNLEMEDAFRLAVEVAESALTAPA